MFYTVRMLVGRRYRLQLNPEHALFAERIAHSCRAVWNAALEQRRIAVELNRHRVLAQECWPTLITQSRELTEAKLEQAWLSEVPRECLQQTLRDLERACWRHGPYGVRFRSRRRWMPSFRFSGSQQVGKPRRINRRLAVVRLPRFGHVRFRWTRPIAGSIRNTTVLRDGDDWYVAFCVDDGREEFPPNQLPAVGVDRGVVFAVAASTGERLAYKGLLTSEQYRLRRLQRQLARRREHSGRRQRTVCAIRRIHQRARFRRLDFAHQVAHRLTSRHGIVFVEDLDVQIMTRSARGTPDRHGRRVRQKAGLNRVILDKGWGKLLETLRWHGRKNGCAIAKVSAAYTSQRCSKCAHVSAESRESQARFRCVNCGYRANADINAAKNILAAGLAVSGRGGLGVTQPGKRQAPHGEAARAGP